MERDRTGDRFAARFDEQSESWIVNAPPEERLVLDRSTLRRLVSLYNQIHRGSPLTLIERRTLHELGRERAEFQGTIRNLYDFIDSEQAVSTPVLPPAPCVGPAASGPAPRATASLPPVISHRVCDLARWTARARALFSRQRAA